MAEGNTRPGWWRTGNVSARLVFLGAVLGVTGAVAHLLSYTLPTFNPVFVLYYLFYLVIEVPVMAFLGLLVTGAVLVARFVVAESATRETRALVTGIVAFISSGALAYVLFSVLPMSAVSSAVGVLTGLLVGSMFALVSYRHTSET